MLKKLSFITAFTFIILLVTSVLVYTYPGGISGRTKKSGTQGCGSCHSQNTAITGSITGPDTVTIGQTVNFNVTITRSGSNAKGGVDIATQLGTLAPGPGSTYLKLLSNELTHKNGLSLTSGTFTCQFSYTAPSSTGIDTIWLTEAIGYSNGWNWGTEKRVIIRSPLGINNNGNTPVQFKLYQNYPNPFNPSTTIIFDVAVKSYVKVMVFDVTGSEVETIVNKEYTAGSYEVIFDASSYSTGVYFYKINTETYTDTKKMTIMK